MDSSFIYEGECPENDCLKQDESENDYEYEYEFGSAEQLYDYCIVPSVFDTFWYFVPLYLASVICNIAARISFLDNRIFHFSSAITGIFTIWYYANECVYILPIFIFISYAFLHLEKYQIKRIIIFFPTIVLIFYCEIMMSSKDWHKVRGVTMIAVMKFISFALDNKEFKKSTNLLEYTGYMICGTTCLFGPWTSFKTYQDVYQKSWKIWWLFPAIGYLLLSFIFISISNCWTSWVISDSSGKWVLAFRDALAFRTSHYFICFFASSIMLVGGYSLSDSVITKPYEIEIPRSLVQVVIWWNIPMHCWLKTYIFRPSLSYLGKFGGIIMTYLASSILHGLNFQLAAVLLSLGFYTYIEFQIRHLLAKEFKACIGARRCHLKGCDHLKTSRNSYWVNLINVSFSILAMFHLAYLGLMFDISESQETGYSYVHTLKKWSELNFASHWVALCMYCAYFLIT